MARRGRPPYPDLLTPREAEVYALLQQGLSNPEIAKRLGISRNGVKYHVGQIYSKLGISSRLEAFQMPATPEPWWRKALAALPLPTGSMNLGAKVAGGAVVAATVAAIALFVWMVLSQDQDESKPFSLFPGLYVVDADSGALTRLVADPRVPDNNFQAGWPWALDWSPDGRHLLLLEGFLVNVFDGTSGRLVATSPLQRAWSPQWLDDGRILLNGRETEGSSEGSFIWDVGRGGVTRTGDPADGQCSVMADLQACVDHTLRVLRVTDMQTGTAILELAGDFSRASLSPDGRRVAAAVRVLDADAYAGREFVVFDLASGSRLLAMPIFDFQSTKPVAWSPDSGWVAFGEFVAGPENTTAITIVNVQEPSETRRLIAEGEVPSWSPSGDRVAYVRDRQHVAIYDLSTGQERLLVSTQLPVILELRWSPDGKALAFLAKGGGGFVHVIDVDGRNERTLLPGHSPSWAPSGEWIAFVYSMGPVFVSTPEGERIAEVGPNFVTDAIPICLGRASYNWSPVRDEITFRGPDVLLARVPPDGQPAEIARNGYGAVFSPDGEHLMFARSEFPSAPQSPFGSCQILEVSPAGGPPTRIASGSAPLPSPDGLHLALTEFRPGSGFGLVIISLANGEVVRESPARGALYWAPLHGQLAYVVGDGSGPTPDAGHLVYLGSIDAEPRTLVEGRFVGGLSWSPDGRNIAFSTLLENRPAVHIVDVANPQSVRFLTYGHSPSWSPDGKRILFVR